MATRAANGVITRRRYHMETGNPIQTSQETTTPNAEPEKKDMFTQDDVNRIVTKRIAKYADYDELKAKAQKYDEQVEASKTELQKATERAEGLQKELDALKSAEQLRTLREEVATAKGVPANLLTGSTKEECEQQADALLSWKQPKGYPKVPDGGDPQNKSSKSTRDQFADWLNSI